MNRYESLSEFDLSEFGLNISIKIPDNAYIGQWVYGENLDPSIANLDPEVLINFALIIGVPVRRLEENDKIHAQLFLLQGVRREVRTKFLTDEESVVESECILLFSPDIEIIKMPKTSGIADSYRLNETPQYELPERVGGSTFVDISMLLPTRISTPGKLIISRWGVSIMYDVLPASID